jgi:8-oxo-dGTP pyrophosphatase MutT (NUDIX family)
VSGVVADDGRRDRADESGAAGRAGVDGRGPDVTAGGGVTAGVGATAGRDATAGGHAGWTTTGSRVVYENRWIRVREDDVVRPDGGAGVYGVVEVRQPSVFVVALTDDDEVVLVSQRRYTTGAVSVEVPAGGTDGEDPLVAAQRELAEETGLAAREWTAVGRMDALNGIADAPEHVFLARGLAPVEGGDDGRGRVEEGIDSVRTVPFADALRLVADGTIRDGETIAALAFAAIHLRRFH